MQHAYNIHKVRSEAMYTPKHFEERSPDELFAHIRNHPLATVVTNSESGLSANHIPLLLHTTDGQNARLSGHVARGNPVWKQVPHGASVLAIFLGPQHYVTPNWYPSKEAHGKAVPTWNYSAVHVSGLIRWRTEPEWLLDVVTRLTDIHESNSPNPWRVSDAPADYIASMLEAIVGLEIEIVHMEGKWKVSQNRSAADVEGVIRGLDDIGTESSAAMSQLVQSRQKPS